MELKKTYILFKRRTATVVFKSSSLAAVDDFIRREKLEAMMLEREPEDYEIVVRNSYE